MHCETVHLKDFYSFLGAEECDARLALYLPYNLAEMHREEQKRPTILLCPGGGYGMCSERESEPIALHYLAAGYNVCILTYSVKPHRFPQQLLEVAAAMELIYANCDTWHCDTEHIAIMGFSAGAHLAAHYANCYDCAEIRARFPESKPVGATVLCYPVITAQADKTHAGSFRNLVGYFPLTEEETERFSIDRQVHDGTPPAFLWHTAADNAVPVQNSLLYAAALSEHKIPFELHVYPFGYHGMSTCDRLTIDGEITRGMAHAQRWMEESLRWLKLIWNIE